MTNEQIKQLEKELWDAADNLRANSKLTAAEYKDPVLGLILLRFAQNRYEEAAREIDKKLPINPRTGEKRSPTKEDFTGAGAIMLQEIAKYDYLAALPDGANINESVNNAMKAIEEDYPDLAGILPRNYQELDAALLRDLIRVFNKESVRTITGDVFGRIYEYFLMKFSMSGAGAQEGGEFFTPPSLVNLIVNFIEPDHGIIHDPACGSGGMFVQTGYFVKDHAKKGVNEAIKVYGTELKTNNAKLAKMNLAIHGIEGTIIEENSFYADPHSLLGQCDFVMANPPFNVNKIDKGRDFVKNDPRLPFGLPNNDNGNYLWIQYFYSYLNPTGRAGFVMASSATDAGASEALIRQQLVNTGAVEAVVSIGNNFFYTRSLPCHVWFFNKAKRNPETVLMIDARKLFRVVSTTINDFSPGQLANLTAIMRLHREEEGAYDEALEFHRSQSAEITVALMEQYGALMDELELSPAAVSSSSPEAIEAAIELFENPSPLTIEKIKELEEEISKIEMSIEDKKERSKALKPIKAALSPLSKAMKNYHEAIKEKLPELKQSLKDWNAFYDYFPSAAYRDIEGLCKRVGMEELEENDYSLTPGRYVGVSVEIDHTFDYKGRLRDIHAELETLNREAATLSETIAKNIQGIL